MDEELLKSQQGVIPEEEVFESGVIEQAAWEQGIERVQVPPIPLGRTPAT